MRPIALVVGATLLGTGYGAAGADAVSALDRYSAASASDWRDPSPHRTGFVTGDDASLHYLDRGGRGETVIFLPALASTAHAFDDIAPRLTDRFRVLALTPRTDGESRAADTIYTVERAAEDVKALMDTLSIERAHLVGHSISGATLTVFAARYPTRVGKLICLDATFAA